MNDSRAPSLRAVISIRDQWLTWLLETALPLWDQRGIDRLRGGYFESLSWPTPDSGATPDTSPIVGGDVRRGRVVARQVYVFGVGERLGWRAGVGSAVDHGAEYLLTRFSRGDGLFHTAVDGVSHAAMAPFSLYEHAFYLFALARLQPTHAARWPVRNVALACLEALRRSVGHPLGGFEESSPPSLPLKSNPHMHLLEAALAWIEVTSGDMRRPWIELAQEIVSICLTHFRDASTGAIREYFDYDWRPAPGEDGRIVEPGHQFEWAWLLMSWARLGHGGVAHGATCRAAARELITLGERWGVEPGRGVAINEIWDDMSPKDRQAKLWPQTERVKAWCSMLDMADNQLDAERACAGIATAATGMNRYLRSDAPGLWYETYSPDGEMTMGPTKASSLYHIVCAVDVLRSTVDDHLAAVGRYST